MLARKKAITCKFCDETGGILLIILWMSYFLRPHSIGLLTAAKTVSSQKKGQNLTSFIAKFTGGEPHIADSSRPSRPADEIYERFGSATGERVSLLRSCSHLLVQSVGLCYTPWCWEERKRSWEQHRHRKGHMPRVPLHALIWSREQSLYELYTQGQLQQRFQPTDEAAWLAWLGSATAFAFHGKGGSLNVYLEGRPRGGAYWYAYHTSQGRTRKRYLGRMETLSLAHLEETARTLLPEQQPAQMLDQGMLLLSGRLAPPRLPNALVEREHLLSALDRALATPLTLLSASAGWGKTTLLSAWAGRHTAQVAWLSLDELDNSPTRFWVSLIAALRHCGGYAPSFGETAVALLQSPQPPSSSTILTALLHELESREVHPAPIVLIVDDYQVIEDPAIHQGMSFFLEHLPAKVHLILSSRVDPDLPLARWRVRGQLTEVRAADLRFREVEASQFLGQMLSLPLSEAEAQRLLSRTAGWSAGVHLAALTTPPRLDASGCRAVSAEPERRVSRQLLEWLERATLFLVSLDEERRSYRLHDLLREARLPTLHTPRPEIVPVLHRRAASFYEAQGEWAEAITHALQAADYSTAARLMEQTVEQFWLRGEAATIPRWLLALPSCSAH